MKLSMLRSHPHRAIVSFALIALLVVFAAVSNGAHRHLSASSDACQVCQVAHGPALEAMCFAPRAPVAVLSWRFLPVDSLLPFDPAAALAPGRAPPAS